MPTGASPTSNHTAEGIYNKQWIHETNMSTIGTGHDYWYASSLRAPGSRAQPVPTPGRDPSGTATVELRVHSRSSYDHRHLLTSRVENCWDGP